MSFLTAFVFFIDKFVGTSKSPLLLHIVGIGGEIGIGFEGSYGPEVSDDKVELLALFELDVRQRPSAKCDILMPTRNNGEGEHKKLVYFCE